MSVKPAEEIFEGIWVANKEKSDLDPNHRFQQATMCLRRTENGYELRAEGIGPDGESGVDAVTFVLDGSPHSVSAMPDATMTATLTHPHRIEMEGRHDGRVIGQASYEVSADGRTLTAETWGTDVKGRAFKTRVVFERVVLPEVLTTPP
jgi:hypothetical protein